MNEKVYTRFGDYNLNIPFPQMDVRSDNKEEKKTSIFKSVVVLFF
jgi:small conductance mechanosensitive channel